LELVLSISNSSRRFSGRPSSYPSAALRSLEPGIAGFLPAKVPSYEGPQNQAELFYLQKQIQAQTPMVIVLEDGQRLEGVIEWYDRDSIKLRGRQRTLVYKSAIKYMHKQGDPGQ
jgi:RNA chaperone Hfq